MGKRTKKAVGEPRKMTKRQLSKFEREQKLSRITKVAAVVVFVLVAAVLAFGFYREVLGKPGESVARVDGKDISLGEYAKVLGYVDFNLDVQRAQLQDLISQSAAVKSEQDFTRQFAQQSLQQLELTRSLLPSQVLDELIEDELIRQEAARRGITVTAQEIDEGIVKQFSPSPAVDASSPVTTTGEVTSTNGQVTQTKTITEATDELRKGLAQADFLTVDEYRRYVVEPSIYRDKLQQALAGEISPSREQVHARHILVDTEDQAKDVLRMLKDENLDFDAVAKQMSKDNATKEKGGDLGWFPRGVMTKPFEEAAFKLQVGELSEPVVSDFGFHIIRVDERADDRPLSEEHLNQLKSGALSKWLSEQKLSEASKVQRFDTPERVKWANDFVSNKRKEMLKRAQSTSKQGAQ